MTGVRLAVAGVGLLVTNAVAQNVTWRGHPSATITTAPSFTYSTTTFNYSAGTSTYLPLTDFSNEQLQFLWDQVGSISTAAINTTVSPTPEPSSFPKPGFLHPLVPDYVPKVNNATLPKNFLWGVASSALQVEGAADAEGKGPSVWDFIPHRWTNSILDNTTADVAADNYYLYKQDNARLKALGIQSYSFSLAWTRFFPFGRGPVNEQGVAHYDDLFEDLMKNGIIPVVTIFHWDTPLALFNSYGAWTSRESINDFVRYAQYVITRYDKYVHTWYTFNEPQYCNWRFSNYPYGTLLPSYNGIGHGGLRAEYLCGHYTLLAHAEVYKWYKNVFKGTKPMSFKNSGNYAVANSSSAADAQAVLRSYDYNLGWFGGMSQPRCRGKQLLTLMPTGPYINHGDYPESMKNTLGDILPTFTEEEKALIRGSADFYAIDGYTAYYVAAPPNGIEACAANSSDPNYPTCYLQVTVDPDTFPTGPSSDAGATWLWSTPTGIRGLLNFLTKDYFNVPNAQQIVVSEFGFAEPAESSFDTLPQILWDLRRSDYMQGYLDNILAARVLDGVDVIGAFAWAIYDNFEWNSGLGTKFGLQYLNLTSQERVPKASMFQFLNFFQQHGLNTSPPANITAPQGGKRK